VVVRQRSFTDGSPTRGSAVKMGVSGLVVAQHLERRALRSRYPIRHGPCTGSSPVPSQSWGPGGRAKGGCADPSPSSPALVSRPATACQRRSIATFCSPPTDKNRTREPLLANRRPPIVWVSTVLEPRSLSGLVYPSLDRATGTAVARARAIHDQPAAPSSRTSHSRNDIRG